MGGRRVSTKYLGADENAAGGGRRIGQSCNLSNLPRAMVVDARDGGRILRRGATFDLRLPRAMVVAFFVAERWFDLRPAVMVFEKQMQQPSSLSRSDI